MQSKFELESFKYNQITYQCDSNVNIIEYKNSPLRLITLYLIVIKQHF